MGTAANLCAPSKYLQLADQVQGASVVRAPFLSSSKVVKSLPSSDNVLANTSLSAPRLHFMTATQTHVAPRALASQIDTCGSNVLVYQATAILISTRTIRSSMAELSTTIALVGVAAACSAFTAALATAARGT